MKNIVEEIIPKNILNEMIDYLYSNGLIIKNNEIGVTHLPIIINPSPIIKSFFDKIHFTKLHLIK
jgi:hypothetical protein